MLDKRSWKRESWTMITERKLAWFEFDGGFCGAIEMMKVSEPFAVGNHLVICDEGITWVQCAWKDKKIWATAMFDKMGNLFQVYFDVADEVYLQQEESGFVDLIVDVVYDPKGKAVVLDIDELDDACQKGLITFEQKQSALVVSERLKNELESHFEQVNPWFEMMYGKVKKIL